jgi:hypothetical protein
MQSVPPDSSELFQEAYVPTVFEIKLKEVLVIENGTLHDDEGVNLISCSLLYPREGVPMLVSARSLTLEDNTPFDYTKREFHEQLLFKESIRDSAMLLIELSSIAQPSLFEKLLGEILGGAVKAAIGLAAGLGPIVTGALTVAASPVLESARQDEKVTTIGRGIFPIREEAPDGDLPITLEVPDEITLTKTALNDKGDVVRVSKKLPGGFVNGRATVSLRKLGSVKV